MDAIKHLSSAKAVWISKLGGHSALPQLISQNRFTVLQVRHEAKLAMEYLDSKAVDAFDVLFMTPVPFVRKFDHVFQ